MIESLRIPVVFAITMWLVVFAILMAIEAVWFIDDHLLTIS